MWQPPSSSKGYKGPASTVCAGYVCKLPEAIEIMRARTHWEKGQLEAFCGGMPEEQVLVGIEILDNQYHAMQRWLNTPESEGGGGR
jgi:hypothetical protein